MDGYKFIAEKIDSVPHLEALILFWNSRPVGWSMEDLASRLYVPVDRVSQIVTDLIRLQIARELQGSPVKFAYLQRSAEQDELMRQVDTIYRNDLVRVSTMIHEKASSPVREFARAFKFRKEPNA